MDEVAKWPPPSSQSSWNFAEGLFRDRMTEPLVHWLGSPSGERGGYFGRSDPNLLAAVTQRAKSFALSELWARPPHRRVR
jgi:hypothetical protein